MKNSFTIVFFFVLGTLIGFFNLLPHGFSATNFSVYVLYVLMFLVGISVGADKKALKLLRSAKLNIILVPLTVVVGTAVGVSLISLFLKDITLHESLAVGAGYGYYSLSSIFISQASGEALGVVALMANIFREIITLLTAPFLARYFGAIAPIASGGATSMDTTLPIIAQVVGKEYAVLSVFSGVVLTILVPFSVPFILSL